MDSKQNKLYFQIQNSVTLIVIRPGYCYSRVWYDVDVWFDRSWIIHLRHWAPIHRRLKEVYPSIKSFDAEGLLIMTCHQKYPDQFGLFWTVKHLEEEVQTYVFEHSGKAVASDGNDTYWSKVSVKFSWVCAKAWQEYISHLKTFILQNKPSQRC